MGAINARDGKLYVDFRFKGVRCREQTSHLDNPQNRKRLEKLISMIEAEIKLGKFDYSRYFPDSPKVEKFENLIRQEKFKRIGNRMLFGVFAEIWFAEKQVEWRQSQIENIRGILDKHLLPVWRERELHEIQKADIMDFRRKITEESPVTKKRLSSSRINHILSPLKMIVEEAADRFEFESPWRGIKQLSVPRTEINPFTMDEVKRLIKYVRDDFKNYYTVRFFTGLRTGEIDGLQWKYVDLDNRQLLIYKSLVNGNIQDTKTDGSYRHVDLSEPVIEALKAQRAMTANRSGFVFCSATGTPLQHRNVTKRVWYPLLRRLNILERNPYQSRHTTATLWLAAGESPEWIAKQLGHTSTAMLFRVYSRYVPNLTRKDGSAFEKLLTDF
ncbi:site-specific integrase [Paraneptunicella aestuarii]|uniref:Arm DNA-binding domain-containing protein n=1 Tax=Paraneptunicella aestuarii TaxID=2831148 RepID=UPI001E3271C4|nr:DUF3596 domain-containing protein [Paraneptunicella aestuarii]UAA37228.1 site-specific integrase [Paraneptunicella aestuarii]